jgi:hypothetical protein
LHDTNSSLMKRTVLPDDMTINLQGKWSLVIFNGHHLRSGSTQALRLCSRLRECWYSFAGLPNIKCMKSFTHVYAKYGAIYSLYYETHNVLAF